MKEETIFPNRLKEVITPAKTDSFFSGPQRTRLPENAIPINPHCLRNQKAQRFSDVWYSQRHTAAIEQKDRAGMVFITKVLGLSKEIARKFADGDRGAFNSVGMKQAANTEVDLAGFWRSIGMIFPSSYSDEDIDFLVKCGINAVTHFLDQIKIPGTERAPVLHLLAKNAHMYI